MRRWLLVTGIGLGGIAGLLGLACLTVGCSTLGYYAQSVNGHLDLVQRARPVDELTTDTATPVTCGAAVPNARR